MTVIFLRPSSLAFDRVRPMMPALESGVIRLTRVAAHAGNGREIDDPSGFLPAHLNRRVFCKVEGAHQIRVDDLREIVFRHSQNELIVRNTGVVHQNIHPTEFLRRLFYSRFRECFVAHVSFRRKDLRSVLRELFCGFLRRLVIAAVAEQQICSLLRKFHRDPETDSAHSSGDHRTPAF